MSIMRRRTRDPNGVPDWDEVDPEDPDNFDKPWIVRWKRDHVETGRVEEDKSGTEEKERLRNDEEARS
jgi:hypothetical protein